VASILAYCANCENEFTVQDLDGGNVINFTSSRGRECRVHARCPKGSYYPEMPPKFVDETHDQYTDRLTGADGTDRRPYDHNRYRQCSLGWHDECSAERVGEVGPDGCACPHHTDPDYRTLDEQERDEYVAEATRIIRSVFAAAKLPEELDDASFVAAESVVRLFDEDDD
jgi:hypothetical protein